MVRATNIYVIRRRTEWIQLLQQLAAYCLRCSSKMWDTLKEWVSMFLKQMVNWVIGTLSPSFDSFLWIRPLCFSHIQFPILLARSNNSKKSTSERTISSSQPKNWYHSLISYLAEHVRPFNSSNKFMGENLPTPSCLWWPYSFGYSWCLS